MANPEHLKILKQGVALWNQWRLDSSQVIPNLIGADLRDADLRKVNFSNTLLGSANLSRADLQQSSLHIANTFRTLFGSTNMRQANLAHARLEAPNLRNADLSDSDLRFTMIRAATLSGANFAGARLNHTILAGVNLSEVSGLDSLVHYGPSAVDHVTLQLSGPLPHGFLRGCGLPDNFIDNIPALFHGDAIQFYSCFISYSSGDEEFVKRLYADLQNSHVRCWYAPEDMKIGERILDTLDSAIRLRDKTMLVLSESSISSDWVEDEVTTGFEEERRRKQTVIFPVRLDDTVMESTEPWAAKLRGRHIGDFRNWKEHDAYQAAFQRLLRDLKKVGAA